MTKGLSAFLMAGGVALGLTWSAVAPGSAHATTTKEELGRQIFFDARLSATGLQSCATCHAPASSFSDVLHLAVGPGAVVVRAGSRNAPTAMYTAFTPALSRRADGSFVGGLFVDGRVNTLEEQAKKPFLNPLEMANPSVASLVAKLSTASYAAPFKAIYGANIFADPEAAFGAATDAIASYERSPELSPFTAKYDAWQAGRATLSASEARGLALFNGKARCATCHQSVSNEPGGARALFTNHTYANVGVPRNAGNPFYLQSSTFNPEGWQFVDVGLAGFTRLDHTRGQFKVPTLRNIANTWPYMHNGYFLSLTAVVNFYNTRDTRRHCASAWTGENTAQLFGCWPAPEVPDNVNRTEMGRLGLSGSEVDDVVSFLRTLTDGWRP